MPKYWNFIKNQAEEIELHIEGEIIDDDWAWIYDWFGIPCASKNKFRTELEQFKGQDITVWIDSWGGDVFAAAGIYTALKNHKGKVTTKVDGKAVSAASVIMQAADPGNRFVSPASMVMIHNPWGSFSGEVKDLELGIKVLNEVKETIINAYQLCTKRKREDISQMMDEVTYMSGNKAIAEGFADDFLFNEEGTLQVQNSMCMVSGFAIQNSINLSMDKFLQFAKQQQEQQTPATMDRIVDYKRRVSVREKSLRRVKV
jgi:ATP-dependent Clp protease protease subunit